MLEGRIHWPRNCALSHFNRWFKTSSFPVFTCIYHHIVFQWTACFMAVADNWNYTLVSSLFCCEHFIVWNFYVTLLTHWPLRSLLVILFGYVRQRELQYNRATQYAAARLWAHPVLCWFVGQLHGMRDVFRQTSIYTPRGQCVKRSFQYPARYEIFRMLHHQVGSSHRFHLRLCDTLQTS